VEQLHKIYKLCGSPSDEYWKKSKLPNATLFKPREPYKRCIRETFKGFPPSALPLIDNLLAIDPVERKTASDALRNILNVCAYLKICLVIRMTKLNIELNEALKHI
ncbi:putative serine/threonine-protein kinase, partial [Trifolium medium]|nr:putative serine/threonine-protein kinase [Trifolium medium]